MNKTLGFIAKLYGDWVITKLNFEDPAINSILDIQFDDVSLGHLIWMGFLEELVFRGWMTKSTLKILISITSLLIFSLRYTLLSVRYLFYCSIPFIILVTIFVHYATIIKFVNKEKLRKILILTSAGFAYFHIVNYYFILDFFHNPIVFVWVMLLLFIRFPAGLVFTYVRIKFGLLEASIFHIVSNILILLI